MMKNKTILEYLNFQIRTGNEEMEFIIRKEKSDKLLFKGTVKEAFERSDLLYKKIDQQAVLHGTTTVLIVSNLS